MPMAISIQDLYAKYTDQVGQTLEDDRYFQYLFEMVQAGDNTLQQNYRILHKVVDEQWLTKVEEGIEAIFNIVDKPRRFIATSEEVVPVALAKKITADSVRHLSQNTQFVTVNQQGEIQPTHILNVTTEESFDLYENRFVYHLIQRLFAFVDKRTDVIFWTTGDETCNVMSMESKIDDAYEEISYKVEMTIKNRQSVVENDTDNMDLFKRIDRVRRLSRTLRASSFCDIMNGCAKVRSPIQRTNLMMKDPDYRTCYSLWQFIENYDEVGYTIEERDTALEFDEEYLLQMYTNLITNYTVFKSLLESDPRKMTEIAEKKREPVKPKFVKTIQEEIVEDRNIPDVEIRQVFVEEVTQAQLDAEKKLEEETSRRESLENSVSDLEWQLDSISQQMEILEQMKAQTEQQMTELQTQLEQEKETREAAETALKTVKQDAKTAIDAANKEAKSAAELAETAQKEARERVRRAEQEAADRVKTAQTEAQNVKQQAEQAVQAAQSAARSAQQEAKQTAESEQKKASDMIAEAKKQAEASVAAVQKETEQAVQEAKQAADEAVENARKRAEEMVKTAQKQAEEAIEREKKRAQEMIAAAQKQAADTVEAEQKRAAESVESSRKKAEEEVAAAQRSAEEAHKRAQRAEKERQKAQEKADANSLSHYILQTLKERRSQRQNETDTDDNDDKDSK